MSSFGVLMPRLEFFSKGFDIEATMPIWTYWCQSEATMSAFALVTVVASRVRAGPTGVMGVPSLCCDWAHEVDVARQIGLVPERWHCCVKCADIAQPGCVHEVRCCCDRCS
jgi:hypothetical protein